MINSEKTPFWFLVVIILVALPVFQMPWLLSACQPESFNRTLVWIYPFYVLMAGYLAYICYPKRQAMSWILLILMIMTHLAIWQLVINHTPLIS